MAKKYADKKEAQINVSANGARVLEVFLFVNMVSTKGARATCNGTFSTVIQKVEAFSSA